MTSLADLVEPLKRYVAVPGAFEDTFPTTSDEDLIGSLLDGFAESQLDGYFTSPVYSATDEGEVSPDISRAEAALVTLYASTRIITTQLINLKTLQRYQAGNLVYETQQTAGVLTAILKDLQARKDAIIKRSLQLGAGAAFEMADAYYVRATISPGYAGQLERNAYYDFGR